MSRAGVHHQEENHFDVHIRKVMYTCRKKTETVNMTGRITQPGKETEPVGNIRKSSGTPPEMVQGQEQQEENIGTWSVRNIRKGCENHQKWFRSCPGRGRKHGL